MSLFPLAMQVAPFARDVAVIGVHVPSTSLCQLNVVPLLSSVPPRKHLAVQLRLAVWFWSNILSPSGMITTLKSAPAL